jgi:hypothetical protein
MNGSAVLYKSTQIKTRGGSRETEVKELTVRPASPSWLRVTAVTPVAGGPSPAEKIFQLSSIWQSFRANSQMQLIIKLDYICR